MDKIAFDAQIETQLRQQLSANLQLSRAKAKLFKFQSARITIFLIFFLLLLLHTLAIAFFTKGFLLTRQVLLETSNPQEYPGGNHNINFSVPNPEPNLGWTEPQFDRAVIIVIDALRFDFTVPGPEDASEQLAYHNSLSVLYETATEDPNRAFLLRFIADPPTTTLQRLKALATGSLPTIVDAGSNFDGTDITEDSWLSQMTKLGKRIAFFGDDTWMALFSKFLHPKLTVPYDSLNVRDIHTVDNGVVEHLLPLIADKESYGDWDVAVGHLLGVDHVGHSFGPNHITMTEKLLQMDEFIRNVMDLIDDNTLLVVFGDHGMNPQGDHGGDSQLEVEAALWMYSKKPIFKGGNGEEKIGESDKSFPLVGREVDQIDFVPTISLLLGSPIPFNNLGAPIAEAFRSEIEYARAQMLTAAQIERYWSAYPGLELSEPLRHSFTKTVDLWQELHRKTILGYPEAELTNLARETVAQAAQFQSAALADLRARWATFDVPLIIVGLVLLAAAVGISAGYGLGVPAVVALQLYTRVLQNAGRCCATGVFIGWIAGNLWLPLGALWGALLGLAIGITLAFVVPILGRYSSFGTSFPRPEFTTVAAVAVTVAHATLFASNSFVVWEDAAVTLFVQTAAVALLIVAALRPAGPTRVLAAVHAAVLLVVSRIAAGSRICREEQNGCVSTFYGMQFSSVSAGWVVAVLTVAQLLLPGFVKSFFVARGSYDIVARAWLGAAFRLLCGLIAAFWLFEYAETAGVPFFVRNHRVVSDTKHTLSRVVLAVSFVGCLLWWWFVPLCIDFAAAETEKEADEKSEENSEKSATIPETASGPKIRLLGFENIYGSAWALLLLAVFLPTQLCAKPMGAICMALLLYMLLTCGELFGMLGLQNSAIPPVVLGLLGSKFFFATGHQATLSAIHWDAGFITSSTVMFPLTHVTILLNTMGSVILTALAVPLPLLWGTKPAKNPNYTLSMVAQSSMVFLFYHSIVALSAFIFAAFFRRHLMVWKIFAPRYLVAALTLMVADATVVLGSGWNVGRLLLEVGVTFGM